MIAYDGTCCVIKIYLIKPYCDLVINSRKTSMKKGNINEVLKQISELLSFCGAD